MNLRKTAAFLAVGLGTLTGAAALSSPAWAACSISAYAPVKSGNSLQGTVTRSGCAGNQVDLESRLMKNVVAFPDAPVANAYKRGIQNGSVTAVGDCRLGRGQYYTWAFLNGNSSVESTRDDYCY
jgi:hypothetical protein